MICHNLLAFKFFQTCVRFFLLLSTKYILKNTGNRTADNSYWLPKYGKRVEGE